MGNAESQPEPEDVPESFGVRVSSKLLESLNAADQSPDLIVTMTGLERRQLVEAAYQEGANAAHGKMVEIFREEQLAQHQALTELHDSLETPALNAVDAKIKALQEREYRAPTRDVPCADERSECLRCYSANSETPLNCAETVAALEKCALAVRQIHLQAEAAK